MDRNKAEAADYIYGIEARAMRAEDRIKELEKLLGIGIQTEHRARVENEQLKVRIKQLEDKNQVAREMLLQAANRVEEMDKFMAVVAGENKRLEARIKELEYERDRWKHVRENAPDWEKLWAEQKARVEELEAENGRVRDEFYEWRIEKRKSLEAAEARIKELEKALLWLRNHYDVGRPELKERVLARIDAIIPPPGSTP